MGINKKQVRALLSPASKQGDEKKNRINLIINQNQFKGFHLTFS